MGLRNNIRNFLYAVTHANQLVSETQRLRQELTDSGAMISTQKEELRVVWEYLSFTECHQERLRSALRLLAPKELSLDTLRELYSSVIDTPRSYDQAGQYLLEHQWSARSYLQDSPVWTDIEKEVYRIALNQADIIPYEYDFTAQNHLREQATQAIGEKLKSAQLPPNMPVGRIDYLSSSGAVQESMEYHEAGKFVSDVLHSNLYSEPMEITVYSDPKTGTHIDTSWRLQLDPLPQGFHITPYPGSELTASEPAPIFESEPEL